MNLQDTKSVMDTVDLLEKRIDALTAIVGPLPNDDVTSKENNAQSSTTPNANNSLEGENFVDSLLSANTLISSALSGRENILKIVNRSEELEKYLDPNFYENCQQAKSKEVYINTIAPELAGNFETLLKIKELEPTLGAEYFRNIPDAGKLKNISENLDDLKQQNEILEESLVLAMKRYHEVFDNITESVKQMNERITKIEETCQKLKKSDD